MTCRIGRGLDVHAKRRSLVDVIRQNARTDRALTADRAPFRPRTERHTVCTGTSVVDFVRRGVALALWLTPSIAAAQTHPPAALAQERGAIRAAIAQPPPSVSSDADGLTIQQAVVEAVEHNLGLLADRFNVTIADARLVTAGLRPNPVLSIEGDHLDWLGTDYDRINNAGPQEYSIRTDFLLERGSKRARRIEVAEQARTVGQVQIENSVRQLTLDVQNACADVMLAKETLALGRQSLDAFNNVVQLNERRVRDGDLAEVELLRTQLAQLQFETSVRRAELRLMNARARLQILLGRPPGSRLPDVVDSVTARPAVELATVLDRALRLRPDLVAARAEQARSEAEVRLQMAQGLVDFSIGAEYRRQDGLAGRGNSIGIFFSSPLPVFNRNQGEIARAHNEEQQLNARRQALELTVRNDVETAFSQYETARATLDKVEQTMLARARDVRQITEFSYRRGEASLIEFLDAQRAYNETMQTYNDAKAEFARSLFLLSAASASPMAP
jgi:outer membrane protein, heavy metal efflux system